MNEDTMLTSVEESELTESEVSEVSFGENYESVQSTNKKYVVSPGGDYLKVGVTSSLPVTESGVLEDRTTTVVTLDTSNFPGVEAETTDYGVTHFSVGDYDSLFGLYRALNYVTKELQYLVERVKKENRPDCKLTKKAPRAK